MLGRVWISTQSTHFPFVDDKRTSCFSDTDHVSLVHLLHAVDVVGCRRHSVTTCVKLVVFLALLTANSLETSVQKPQLFSL